MAASQPQLPPRPPQLPPRGRSSQSPVTSESSHTSVSPRPRADTVHLTPYSRPRSQSPRFETKASNESPPPYHELWGSGDTRSSSMLSLLPVESVNESRRKLLLIYIHGFLGNESSFKSFPTHVHNILTVILAESHIVHTKIYPRYKSRRAINYAVDDFSNWLEPNESPTTDVVLLGHSLGGILAAEIALMPSHRPNSTEIRQHRILGVIGFDTPFLGLHPGVVGTGIASLFRSAPDPPETNQSGLLPVPNHNTSRLGPDDSTALDPFNVQPTGPNFNPRFENDIIWNPSKKYWESSLHFVKKHSDGLFAASKQYVMSHLEFGGCLADFQGLKNRYARIRALEDVDEPKARNDEHGQPKRRERRVRFVNYYSASTGRRRSPRRGEGMNLAPQSALSSKMQDLSLATSTTADGCSSGVATPSTGPRLSVEEQTEDGLIPQPLGEIPLGAVEEMEPHPMGHSDAEVWPERQNSTLGDSVEGEITDGHSSLNTATSNRPDPVEEVLEMDELPPLPRMPSPPAPFDAGRYHTKDLLRVSEKEHTRQTKAYERAKKDREKMIRERQKMLQRREKALVKEQEKKEMAFAKEQDKQAKLVKKTKEVEEKERIKASTTLNPETYNKQLQRDAALDERGEKHHLRKKQRDRKFCALPAKDPKTGLRDPTWVRVYMEGVDEVVAHTTLFSGAGEAYEKLVGDTASRIEEWVRERLCFEGTNILT